MWNGTDSGSLTLTQTSAIGCDSTTTLSVIIQRTPAPIIVMANDSVCENKIESYSVAAFSGDSYSWSVSGGSIIGSTTASAIDVLWGSPGTGTVTIVQTSDWGCDSSISEDILIVPTPKPVIVLPNDTACENKILSYSITTPSSGHAYAWSVSGGSIIGSASGSSIDVLWAGPGTGTVSVNQTSAFGCDSAVSENILIIQTPKPVIVLANDSTCENKIATYSITPVAGESYAWSVSGGSIIGSASASSIDVLWAGPGTGTVSVTQTSVWGCDSSVSANVSIVPTPKPVIVLPNDTACENKILSYSVSTPTSGHAYAWSVSGGSIIGSASGTSIDVLWAGPGTGTVSVNQTSAFGCDSAVSENILIIQTPKPVIALANDSTCENKIATYSITPVSGESYAWSVSGGAIIGSASASSIDVLWAGPGTGTVSVTQTSVWGCDSSVSSNVSIVPTPKPVITGDFNPCRDKVYSYTATSVNTIGYNWSIIGGRILGNQNANPVSIIWDSLGLAELRVLALSDFGCDSLVGEQIIIRPVPRITVSGPDTLCQNQTGIYQVQYDSSWSYTWSINGGLIVGPSDQNTITILWDQAQAGKVNISVVNLSGCDTVIQNIPIFVKPTPTPVIEGPGTACRHEISQYSTTLPSGTMAEWAVSGGTIIGNINKDSIEVYWDSSASNRIQLRFLNDLGCDSTVERTILVNPKPKPVILGNLVVCENKYHTYQALLNPGSDPGTHSFNWVSNGGTIVGSDTGQQVEVKWDVTGIGELTLFVRSAVACDSLVKASVIIYPATVPEFDGIDTVCEHEIATYTATPVLNNTYKWTVVNGNLLSSDTNSVVIVIWGTSGVGELRLVQTNANDCDSSMNKTIVIHERPKPLISGPLEVCVDAEEIYSVKNIPADSFYWEVAGGSIIGNTNLSSVLIKWEQAGYGSLRLTQTSPMGCDSVVVIAVNINENPVASIGGSSFACANTAGNPYYIQDYGVDLPSYIQLQWSAIGGQILSSTNADTVRVDWGTSGTFPVILTTTNQNTGCYSIDTFLVSVGVLQEPVIDIADLSGCVPFSLTLNESNISDSVEYSWSMLGKSPQESTLPSPTFLFDDPDIYLIRLIVKNGNGCIDTAFVSVNAAKPVFADFVTVPQDSLLIDDEVIFINRSTGASSYRWEFHNGDTTSQVHANQVFNEPGTYQVKLVAWNDAGCIDSIIKTITILVRPELYVPNAFTPNGDSHNENFSVYAHYIAKLEIIIFDRWGEIIYRSNEVDFAWDGTYKGVMVPEGVYGYYIQARDHYGKINIKKGNITLMR